MLFMNLVGNGIGYLKISKDKNENGGKKISGSLLISFSDKYLIDHDNTV